MLLQLWERAMADFAYTTVPGKIGRLLEKIRTTGIPSTADTVWLKKMGFTSSNDKSLLPVMRQIGLINGKAPTPLWSKYRGADHKRVLGAAIRSGYAELYSVYDDAHQRSNSDITHVFSTTSTAGAQSISKTVATFKSLVAEAEFEQNGSSEGDHFPSSDLHNEPSNGPKATRVVSVDNGFGGASLHLNIQIHISPEASTDQVDAIFSSMAKHLYSRAQ
jgi:hypothetical protein